MMIKFNENIYIHNNNGLIFNGNDCKVVKSLFYPKKHGFTYINKNKANKICLIEKVKDLGLTILDNVSQDELLKDRDKNIVYEFTFPTERFGSKFNPGFLINELAFKNLCEDDKYEI